MNSESPRYADWKAPDEDAQFILWPDAAAILRQTVENGRLLGKSEVMIQGVPLGELRQRLRREIGHGENDQPLIATGHQTELYHPGVWVKDALVNALARKMDGRAWHFVVDTDSPKHLHLRWPGGSMAVSDDPEIGTAAWSGLLDAPSAGYVESVQGAIEAARGDWDFAPMVDSFLEGMKNGLRVPQSLAPDLTTAIGKLDAELGLGHESLVMSGVWSSQAFLLFAHHLLARAGEFAVEYNAALAAYRKEQRITSAGRPMPDLEIGTEEVETPFWVDDLEGEMRGRLVLRRVGGGWRFDRALLAVGRAPQAERLNGFVFEESARGDLAVKKLGEFLQSHSLRISPRALPLTMFFRLFLADQYIHGIGGGRYDQVTDRIIGSFFGMDPPRFSVTTATLYFPAARGQKRINLRPLLEEGRRLRHGSLWREKREIVDRIATLPKRSRERHNLFLEMHAGLAREESSDAMGEWSRRLEEANREQMRQKSIFDRELFFAMQSEDRLRGMISRYDGVVDGS